MDYDEIKQGLKKLVDAKRQIAFTPDYREKATDQEALALLVSQHNEWDGEDIIKTFALALEDANFHDLADQVTKLI